MGEISEITTQCSRSTDNLIGCFRNMKSKVKRQHSEAKMLLKDPSQKEALVSAIEDNGKDWLSVSKETNLSVEVCQMGYDELKKDVKKTENNNKKKIMGTGGGPPEPSDDDPLIRIKKIIEPQIDGLYTIYDGDSDLMKQYQESLPGTDRMQPIESGFIYKNDLAVELVDEVNSKELEINTNDANNYELCETPTVPMKINRIGILKKKMHSAFNVGKKEKNITANDSFIRLSAQKLELVKLNIEVAAEELHERKLNVQLKELEYQHKQKLQALELEAILKENKYKEEMQQKELHLMNLKIKKFTNE